MKRIKVFNIKIVTVFWLLFGSVFNIMAQEVLVTGKVIDSEESQALFAAHVALQDENDLMYQSITNDEGNFSISVKKLGNYKLHVQFVGYETHTSKIKIRELKNIQLEDIALVPSFYMLDEVEVVSGLPVILKKDTIQYSSEAFKTRSDGDVKDLIKKLPGIEIGSDGTVTAEGESVKRIFVDGKEFLGNDPQSALNNLPVNMVQSVQVIDKLSDQAEFTGFDDGSRSKVINIITKKSSHYSSFGKMDGGMGSDDLYSTSGNVNLFNQNQRLSFVGMSNNINQQNFTGQDLTDSSGGTSGGGKKRGGKSKGKKSGGGETSSVKSGGKSPGVNTTHSLGVNYIDMWGDKWDVTGSYLFSIRDNEVEQESVTEYFLQDGNNQFIEEKAQGNSKKYNHRFDLKMDYTIDSQNSILFRPSLSIENSDKTSFSNSNSSLADQTLLNNARVSDSGRASGIDFSNSTLFRHKFQKIGRTLSFDWKLGYLKNEDNTSTYSGINYFDNEQAESDSTAQLGESLALKYSTSGNFVYTEPFGKHMQMQLSYFQEWTKQDANREVYDLIANPDFPILDTDLSNTFISIQQTYRPNVGFLLVYDKFSLTSGMSYQYGTISNENTYPFKDKVDYSFKDFLPELSMNYTFTNSKRLRFSYQKKLKQPGVNELQDVVNNSDPMNISMGNPMLEPEQTHALKFNYRTFDVRTNQMFFINLSASLISNKIGNETNIALNDTVIQGVDLIKGAKLVRPVNLNGFRNANANMVYSFPFDLIRTNVSFNSIGNYIRNIGSINGVESVTFDNSLGQGIKLSSNISERVDFTLSAKTTHHWIKNEEQENFNGNYFDHQIDGNITLEPVKSLLISSTFSGTIYQGDDNLINENIYYWNAYVAKKLFRKGQGELKFSVFDILNQNRSISRSVQEAYLQTTRTNVLPRFFLLSFSYRLNASLDSSSGKKGSKRGGRK